MPVTVRDPEDVNYCAAQSCPLLTAENKCTITVCKYNSKRVRYFGVSGAVHIDDVPLSPNNFNLIIHDTIGIRHILSIEGAVPPSDYRIELEDAVSIADSLARVATYERSLTDVEVVTDALTRSGTFERSLADTIAISDDAIIPAQWADIATKIVIIPTPDGLLTTASEELDTYLSAMSGNAWTVVTVDPGGLVVRLDVDATATEFASRGDEAVRIVWDAAGILITGKTSMATRHGAYILLELLGVRWFFKHDTWTYVPATLNNIGTIDEIYEPSYLWRRMSHPYAGWTAAEDLSADWNMRNRLIGAQYYYVGHNYDDIIPISEYGDHPEYFIGSAPSTPWQLNPENATVISLATQYARDYLDGADITENWLNDSLPPGAACIGPNDGAGFEPPYDEDDWQLITNWVFYLANEVAKVILTEYPGKYITTYNYYLYAGVPVGTLSPNLLPFVTTEYNYTQGADALTNQERIEGLAAKGVDVGIRDYLDWLYYEDDPVLNIEQIKRIGWYATKGAKAYSVGTSDGWGCAAGLTQYLISKLLWNHTLDTDDLLDDFYTKAFGAASATMQSYYEGRDTNSAALQASFISLDAAETLAVGDADVLARIRHLEYYERFVWKWHNVGIENLNQADCEDFYTFITKIRNLYVVYYRFIEADVRDVLTDTWGLSEGEVDALQDFTVPTAGEAATWLAEGLAEFTGFLAPYINPRKINLEALGDTVESELPIMRTWYHAILVPSDGNETVEVLAKGAGRLQWWSPTELQISNHIINSPASYESINLTATEAGNYILYSTRLRPISDLYVDVPDRPASIIAYPNWLSPPSHKKIFWPDDYPTRISPYYKGENSTYFYVPSGTTNFRFGASVDRVDRPAHGTITDPNDTETPFSFDVVGDNEITFTTPVAGIWKLNIDIITASGESFWFVGIPPLCWHDSEYLLVEV